MDEPFHPENYLMYCSGCGRVAPHLRCSCTHGGGPAPNFQILYGFHKRCPYSNVSPVYYLPVGTEKFPHAISMQQFNRLSTDEQKKAIALMEEDIRKSFEPELKEDHFMYCINCLEIAERLPFTYDHASKIMYHHADKCSKGGGGIVYIEPDVKLVFPHGMLISEYNALPDSEKASAMALMRQDVIDEYNSPLAIQGREFSKQIAAKTAGYTAAFKCPNCGSYHSNRISPVTRLASAAVFGIFSKRIDQDYVCRDCGYKW